MQSDAMEILKHVSPNTPQDVQHPHKDKRYGVWWCPFHEGKRVQLLSYITDWGDVWFLCAGGCLDITGSIEHLLATRRPHVTTCVSANGKKLIYEARWSLGSRNE